MPQDGPDGHAGRGQPEARVAQGHGQRVRQLLAHPAGLSGGPGLTARAAFGVVGDVRAVRLDAVGVPGDVEAA